MSAPAAPPADADLKEVEIAERRLRDAALAGDTFALDRLLADDLVFVDQRGQFLSKQDDLDLHRTGALKLSRLIFSDYRLRALAPGAVIAVLRAEAKGHAGGAAFTASLRITRLWHRSADGWRVVNHHATVIS
ncbi:ketosteroid isomerase-like protein [Angulomicrobium tetraedrale]|uniref:Ketosteroid isomerase-like protein n=1 Tax=Ancylobacter tetraedralis TaxID=217068 RepID=A0A839ZBW7_9HYPH|nr:nuclear transport factor 2 family protein [Ancylobacter tetraedralis]MBB3772263.1 ketosteroid isomerase-like protein [Ancylobacter tetraedralis]